MRELLEAGARARRSRGRVDVASGRAGDGGRERGRGGRADGLVRGALLARGAAGDDGACVVGPEAVDKRAELEHDEVTGLDTPRPGAEVLPAVHEVRPRVDGGVPADDPRGAVAVALDLDRGLDRGRDLHLRPARTRD